MNKPKTYELKLTREQEEIINPLLDLAYIKDRVGETGMVFAQIYQNDAIGHVYIEAAFIGNKNSKKIIDIVANESKITKNKI